MAEVVSWSHQQVATDQARDLDRELGDAADEDADRQRQDRRLHVSREQHDTGDHSDVHDGGPDGGREKVAVDLEHPHRQRGQADQREIREHHPRQEDGQIGLRGVVGEPRRDDAKDPRRAHDADDRRHAEREDRGSKHRPHHADELLARPRLDVFAEDRDHRGGERAFGEQAAQHVRDPKGHEERVGDGARAEDQRDDHVPDESQHAREERRPADGPQRADDLALHAHGADVLHGSLSWKSRDGYGIMRCPHLDEGGVPGWRTPSRP